MVAVVAAVAVQAVIALAEVRARHTLLEALAVLLLAVRPSAIAALEMPLFLCGQPVVGGI